MVVARTMTTKTYQVTLVVSEGLKASEGKFK